MNNIKRRVVTLSEHRVVRFGVVGVINTLVDFSIFNTLVLIVGWPVITSNIIAATTAMVVSFLLNKKAVFRNDKASPTQILLFFVFTLTGIWVVQNGVIALLYPLVDALPPFIKLNLVKVLAVIIGLVWNYLFYSNVVFNERRAEIPQKIITVMTKHWKITIALTMLVVVLLGLLVGMGKSVWFDEGYSIIVAQRPVNELVDLTKVDAHPPLYYLYLKAWGSLFGWSELALRLSSIIPTALSIGVMAIIIRRFFTAKTAIISLPFLVTAPLLVRYSYEIRMYALVLLIGVGATYVLLRATKSGSPKWWVGYMALVVLGMYTLYMSIVIWLGHALWLVYNDLSHKRNIVKQRHWVYYLAGVILFLPWVPTVIYQLQNSALPPYMTALDLSALAHVTSLIYSYTPLWYYNVVTIAGTLISLILLVVTIAKLRQRAAKQQWRHIMLFVIIFCAAVVFYFFASLPPNPPRFTERYMLHVSIYLYALVGITTASAYYLRLQKYAYALGVVSLITFVYGLYAVATLGNYNFQRLQPTYGNTVRADVGCDDTTIVTSGAYGYIDMWYEFQGCDFEYYQPVDLTYTGGYAPLNKLNTTKRIKESSDLNSKYVAFLYYDDSTEFITMDNRYTKQKTLNYTGLHVDIYQRD